MTKESLVMGLSGILLGLLAGWIIGSHQAPSSRTELPRTETASSPPAQETAQFDEALANRLKTTAEANPQDAASRVQLGNVYFDGGRFEEAARWYTEALKLEPRNVDASTDLGIAYYYMNQPDRALEQFDRSLAIDPKHSKTLLNIGIVRAWGKQDLDGAAKAWQRVIEVAPGSMEASRAKQGLDGIRAAHPEVTPPPPSSKPGGPSN